MDPRLLIDGLILYLGLLVLLTFHEFGHAWMAWKCGDDTALSQGRVSLNPLVHIDLIGTVAVPLLLIFMAPGGFFAGWAKPVPVNPDNFRNPRADDIMRSEEHTSELQSRQYLVCRLLLENSAHSG